MVKAELGFFEVQREGGFGHSMEPGQAVFGVTPEALDAIDVVGAESELIIAMVHSSVLVIAEFDQTIVAAPGIGMHHGLQRCFAANDGLQCGFGGIWHDLRIDLIPSFQQAEDDGLSPSTPASAATHAARPEVGFVGFQIAAERRVASTLDGQSFSEPKKDLVHAADRNAGHLRRLRSGQIE